jgi:twitching motility protein PilJ
MSIEATSNEAIQTALGQVAARWERVEKNATTVIDNQAPLVSLSKGIEGINQGNNALLELAQQAAAQVAQGGGSLREVDFTNQLAILSQRIGKNANSLVSADEIDPEVAFLLGKDTGSFRDILTGLIRGRESLRLAPVHAEDARSPSPSRRSASSATKPATAILQNMQRLVGAGRARREPGVGAAARRRDQAHREHENQNEARTFTFGGMISIFALLSLIALGKVFRRRACSCRERGENKRNQEAILRLLNDGQPADGDLTVRPR